MATQGAAAIACKGGPDAYVKERRVLSTDSHVGWDEHVKEESHPATAEGLVEFIHDTLEPICFQAEGKTRFTLLSSQVPNLVKGCKHTDWRN